MSILKNSIYLGILVLVLSACATHKKIEKDLTKETEINNYFKGLVVYDIKTNKEIINYNGNKYFTPASNTKLFTFYTAYRTFKDSVVGFQYFRNSDSLIIKGTADPSLLYGFEGNKSIPFLKNSPQFVYLIDDSIEDSPYGDGWAWDDYAYYYMPEKNIFPLYSNLIKLSKNGNNYEVTPSFFKDKVELSDTAKMGRQQDENVFYVKSSDKFTNREIPFKTSNQLVADLLSMEIGKKVTLIDPNESLKLKDFYSIKYDTLYKQLLVTSDNFIAEQLLLQVGNKVSQSFSVEKAIDFSLKNYLKEIPQKPRWVDGSGLSRYNLFTPESLVYLLKKMYYEIPHNKLFAYFPVGGSSGTLKNYYKNDKPYIYAKSGTLSNNHNLSGYLITKKDNILIFSYMNNHYQGSSSERKKEMEAVFLKLYENY